MPEPRLCVGIITGAHGVRGLVKLKSFTASPEDLTAYGPLSDQTGNRLFKLEILSRTKDQFLGRLSDVSDRTAAEGLKGTRLYVARAALPDPAEEEFYHADLIGLEAVGPDGDSLGKVKAVQNYGAGDFLEIAPATGPEILVPFTLAAVPEVDLKEGRVRVVMLPESAGEDKGNEA